LSVSEITGIPRATVQRKINYLINNNYLKIDKKKLLHVKMSKKNYEPLFILQDKNLINLSEFISRSFNQISVSLNF